MPQLSGRLTSTPRERDEEFSELVHASWSSLYRTAYLLLGDHAEAEDLVQAALAKTYASWHRVRDRGAAAAYARTTLVNTAASWFRRRSWRNERPTGELPEHTARAGHGHPDPSIRPALMQALAQLAPRQRAVVVLRFYDDMSVAETAAALGCSAGTVKSQTSDALGRLRVLLGDEVVPQTLGAHHD
jgi:RNA polymerase sigma-70 factor (sigma-E family)